MLFLMRPCLILKRCKLHLVEHSKFYFPPPLLLLILSPPQNCFQHCTSPIPVVGPVSEMDDVISTHTHALDCVSVPSTPLQSLLLMLLLIWLFLIQSLLLYNNAISWVADSRVSRRPANDAGNTHPMTTRAKYGIVFFFFFFDTQRAKHGIVKFRNIIYAVRQPSSATPLSMMHGNHYGGWV